MRQTIVSLRICEWPVAAGLMLTFSSPLGAQAGTGFSLEAVPVDIERTARQMLQDCEPSGSSEEEIVVCGRLRERSRYRLAPPSGWDPSGPVDSVSRERHRLYEQGDAGIGSCSTVGPGGWTGCTLRRWKEAREQYGR